MSRPVRPPAPGRVPPERRAGGQEPAAWVPPSRDARWQRGDLPVTPDMWGAGAMFSLMQDGTDRD
jgi:hypothetical protein